MMEEPRFLLIVSDLHLSEGWDEETKCLSRNEDFFFDTAFARFLQAQHAKSSAGNYRVRLIIPGDFVDFLQVTGVPPGETVDGEPISARERRFGLGTSPAKTCWKLRRIMSGHWRFFSALASFVAAGHDLVILPGNHDIEWVIPAVQNTFKDELRTYVPAEAGDEVGRRVTFRPWFYYEPGFVYIDHGHQYDALNSFDIFLHPFLSDGRIDLPAGSFFVRYLFNQLEVGYPFADNMKPTSRFLKWFLRRALWQPKMWRGIPVYVKFFLETLAKAGPLPPEWKTQAEARQREVMAALAVDSGITLENLQALQRLWIPSAIHSFRGFRLARLFFAYTGTEGGLTAIARRIRELLGVRYVLCGHTHEADLQEIGPGTPRAEYVNSGTWTKIFAESWEERLLRGESEFVVVEFDRRTQRMELLRWCDDLGAAERVRLFQRPTHRS